MGHSSIKLAIVSVLHIFLMECEFFQCFMTSAVGSLFFFNHIWLSLKDCTMSEEKTEIKK